jgi:hypothetical protein
MLRSSIFVKVAYGPQQLVRVDRFKNHAPPSNEILISITGDSAGYLLRHEVRAEFRACRTVRRALRGDL